MTFGKKTRRKSSEKRAISAPFFRLSTDGKGKLSGLVRVGKGTVEKGECHEDGTWPGEL